MKKIMFVWVISMGFGQLSFAANLSYLAQYMCMEAYLKEPLPNNYEEKACIDGFLVGYNDEYAQTSSINYDWLNTIADEYALQEDKPALNQWFIKGYTLVDQLKDYHPCTVNDYCSERTVNHRLVAMFNKDREIAGCRAGYIDFAQKPADALDYRSMIDAINTKIATKFENEDDDFRSGYHSGAVQATRCQ